MSTTTEVLDLSAIAPERDTARLRTKKNPEGLKPDGSLYELANLEDFSPVQIAEFNALVREAEELWGEAKPSKAQADRMQRLFTDAATMVILGASRTDVAQLATVHRRGVVLRFWSALSEATFSTIGPKALLRMSAMARQVSVAS